MLASKPLSSNAIQVDLEGNERNGEAMLREMPKLLQLKLVAKMTNVVSDAVQTRSVLQFLGDRSDHEPVDEARHRVAEIERNPSGRFEEISMEAPRKAALPGHSFHCSYVYTSPGIRIPYNYFGF